LMVSSAQSLRRFVLNETALSEIINLMGYTFEGVNVETIIFSGKKEKATKESKIDIFSNTVHDFNFNQSKEQILFMKNDGHELNVFSDAVSDKIIEKLLSNSFPLDDLVQIKAGLQAYEKGKGNPKQTPEDVRLRIYDYDYKFNEETFQYIEGKDVNRYSLKWAGAYLRYGDNLAAPRTFDIFSGKKIIIREITGKHPRSIIATYSEEIFLFNRSNIAIVEKDDLRIPLKYILGILNSKLMSYYFIKNTAKSVRQMFPKIILEDLRTFPIKKGSNTMQKSIVNLVEQILLTKTSDSNAEAIALETEIDQLVYELYGLTEEEIRIIEN
jgi:adenine-specific DNA-methyltransferase